jgi:hypothetical protein
MAKRLALLALLVGVLAAVPRTPRWLDLPGHRRQDPDLMPSWQPL